MRRECSALVLAAVAALACRSEPEVSPESGPRLEPARASAQLPAVAIPTDYLDDALLEASYDTRALAQFVAALPRPTPTQSPLVALAGGLVEVFTRDGDARLERLGLRADARVRVSARALDGRFAAVAKRLGEFASDGDAPPAKLDALASEARTLGLHVRASIPTHDADRLLKVIEGVLATPRIDGPTPPSTWAPACAALEGAALCAGWPRLLVWARADEDAAGEAIVRADAVYLFYAGASTEDLGRALARAEGWAARPAGETPVLDEHATMQLQIHAEGMLALLRAEALADAVEGFVAEPGFEPYAGYLDRERALRELHPTPRLFDGLHVAFDYAAARDELDAELRWLPAPASERLRAQIFAPIATRPGMPQLQGPCAEALACGRFGGLASVLRYAPLAQGPFTDLTGATRVLRQAGDRGMIMVLLGAWPQLLGTGAALAGGGRGRVAQAQARVLRDSDGLGFVLEGLGPAEGDERWAGYLRLGSEALASLRSVVGLVGDAPVPAALEGVEQPVERSAYDGTSLYFVEEEESGWLVAASDERRVGGLLGSAREIGEQLEPLWFLRMAALGEIAAREHMMLSEDPPVRGWLDGHGFELRGELEPEGPRVRVRLTARKRDSQAVRPRP